MKKFFNVAFLFITMTFCLTLFSCASTVKVKLTRPAELDLKGARTIAVLPIAPYNYYKQYNDLSLGQEILVNLFYQIFKINDPDEQQIIDNLYSRVEHGLLSSPYIKLVSSDSVETAIRKNTLNPADVYLIGQVSYFSQKWVTSEKKKEVKAAKDNQLAEYIIVKYYRREVEFHFNYQIVDSATNKIIASDQYRCTVSSYNFEDKKEVPSAYSLLESDIKKAAEKILHQLQPYVETKSIKLLETKTKDKILKERMKAADKLAKDSYLQSASQEFTRIYEDTDLIEAGYNAAILQEALGNLSLAEKMMEELYQAHPDSRVAKGLSDIRYEITQAKKLQKQISEPEDMDLDF